MDAVIREFRKEDAIKLYDIEKSCFTSCWSLHDFEILSTLDYAHFFVAVADNEIVGFAGIYVLDVAELMNIAVLPNYRRNGIANELLAKCIDCAIKCSADRMMLEVRAANLSAISLYEKFGFCKISVRKNYYSNPTEDANIMIKEF